MPYLISYDIADNKLRLKVANTLLAFGMERIQKSVFMGNPNDTLFQKIIFFFEKKVLNILKYDDSIVILRFGNEHFNNATFYPTIPEIVLELRGEKTVLIF